MACAPSELAPSLPHSEGMAPPATRSELLERRRAESKHDLQGLYDMWEHANPVWAQRRTGSAPSTSLEGRDGATVPGSRRAMLQERKVKAREMAMRSCNFTEAVKERMCAQEPNQLITSISRQTKDPTTGWVEEPCHGGSRSSMMRERREKLVSSLQAASELSHATQDERVQLRVDQEIQALLEAPPGRSRAGLLAARREERASQSEEIAFAHVVEPVELFSAQDAPFWEFDQSKGQSGKEEAATTQSHEELKTARKWHAKPEMYPRVHPDHPRFADPFKLTTKEARYLHGKLSSGPRKSQRGYLPESLKFADKVTSTPAPSLSLVQRPKMAERPHFRQFTDPHFKYAMASPKEEVTYLANPAMADGYEFLQPLYSSFTKSKLFETPKLPPRPTGGARADRPWTTPTGTHMLPEDPSKSCFSTTGTTFRTKSLTTGQEVALQPLSMSRLTMKGTRGGSARPVRSGGFQLVLSMQAQEPLTATEA
ncbi:hypothetical protein AB1Y20_005232 [Prymnesium parvum]|uniref:Ribosome biogenesis protein NOP53 n=1 Tax=Prymnesium parvum TaxID=97485 RepID=A0AB34J3N4_PRYPA